VQTNLAALGSLTFEAPDEERFPALGLARRAARVGGTLPAVFNAANESAVEAFCEKHLRFDQISQVVEHTMDRHDLTEDPTLEQILAADAWARVDASGQGAKLSNLCG
jgi:1-deoxy-D-xylulose-5-phosphate reductoisomerase